MPTKRQMVVGGTLTIVAASLVYLSQQQLSQVAVPATETTQQVASQADVASSTTSSEKAQNETKPVIVGAVFEDGYLVKHGNHYHFVKGVPPANAIFEQQSRRARGASEADEGLWEAATDGYVFDPKDIVSENAQGYVVRHGDHFHFIYKHQLKQTSNGTTRHHSASEGDHYQFNPADIVSEDANGYVVRHGDHFHYIWKSQGPVATTSGQNTYSNRVMASYSTKREESEMIIQDRVQKTLSQPNRTDKKEFAGIHYRTSDGFLFDGQHILSETSLGLLVAHNGNAQDTHLIPYMQLIKTPWQRLIPDKYLAQAEKDYGISSNQANVTPTMPSSEQLTPEPSKPVVQTEEDRLIEAKINRIMQQYGLKRDVIVVDRHQNAIIYPHGDHHHAEPIDEHKPYGGGHAHHNYEIFKPEDGVATKKTDKIYHGVELEDVIKLLKANTFNNQAFTLDKGQKRISFVFSDSIESKLGTNMTVKLTTPDGTVLEKVSGRVFGEGVGNIANFELDKAYLPGSTFKYQITSKDYPEVSYEGTFTVKSSLAYQMARHTIFQPFYAGDKVLKLNPQYAIPEGTEALTRVFDDFHGSPYLENNYRVGPLELPIPSINQGTTSVAGNTIPVTFMANPYEPNEVSYIVEVPILDRAKDQGAKASVLKQFADGAAHDQQVAPEPALHDELADEPEEMDGLPTQLAAIAERYGVGLDHFIFLPNGEIQLRLPNGEIIPIDVKQHANMDAPMPLMGTQPATETPETSETPMNPNATSESLDSADAQALAQEAPLAASTSDTEVSQQPSAANHE